MVFSPTLKRLLRSVVFFMLFCGVCISPLYSIENNGIFYIRSDIKTINGEVVETNLLMVPADEEFRVTSFNRYVVSGASYQNSKPDMVSAADHNAFSTLLHSHGIKSVDHKSVDRNASHYEESVLSYEGFIKVPYSYLNQNFDPASEIYSVQLEVYFAPVAFPSEWSYYYFKKKLYDLFHNMISVFM